MKSAHWSMSCTGSRSRSRFTILAGTPTATQCAGRSVTTRLPAPILLPAPTTIGPSSVAPAPSSTPWPTVGWRTSLLVPEPPRDTWCSMDTLSPTMAVSPITTPVAWSSRMPIPSCAAGWMSTWKTSEARLASARARDLRPLPHSQWHTRWLCTAWNPLKYSMHCTNFSQAGSRSLTASMSATAASTMLGSSSYASWHSFMTCTAPSVVPLATLLASRKPSVFSRLLWLSTVL
mmetsp:Transcript_29172/g.64479  ORF Transcript_29172/g.64479 Transcript_29172/m.64479 type:complete len:233 (-) Transcript_29172:730-1428(-)